MASYDDWKLSEPPEYREADEKDDGLFECDWCHALDECQRVELAQGGAAYLCPGCQGENSRHRARLDLEAARHEAQRAEDALQQELPF